MNTGDAKLILGPIIGGLSHNSANLWGRADREAVLHAWIGKQPDLSDAILAGTSLPLTSENGFAGVVPLSNLAVDREYYYSLSLFDRMPSAGIYPKFRTFQRPGVRSPFNFAFGSCFRPAGDEGGKIFTALEDHRKKDELRFLILTGDQVYSDDHITNSLGRAAYRVEDYRAVYAHIWSHEGFRQLLYNLPAFMILDDHEVDDDWRWLDEARTKMYIPWWDRLIRIARGCSPEEVSINPQKVRNALQVYWEHQGMHAPPQELSMALTDRGQYSLLPADDGSLAYMFTCGAAAFFVMDTRTMRSRQLWPWSQKSATVLGSGQWSILESWLLSVKDDYPLKFLISSSSVLFDFWFDITRDRWSGYRAERDRLFKFLAEEQIEGVHILAGDLHSAHAIRMDLVSSKTEPVRIWEFCSSPFDQKTNSIARKFYKKLKQPLVTDQVCQFIRDKKNFGVVRVNYDTAGKPEVRFELYGVDGELLAVAGEGAG